MLAGEEGLLGAPWMSGCELVLACVVGAASTLCWTLWLGTFIFVWCGWCGWWPVCRCWCSLRLALTCCQRVCVRPFAQQRKGAFASAAMGALLWDHDHCPTAATNRTMIWIWRTLRDSAHRSLVIITEIKSFYPNTKN